MIENFGIGIDVSSIKKFKNKPFDKNKSFYKKIFLDEEIAYCLKFKNASEKFAGKFAAFRTLLEVVHCHE